MTTKYTPGPWLRSGMTIYTLRPCKWLGADSVENAWSALVMPDGQHKTSEAEIEANARLIAAAPELVEALRSILEMEEELQEQAYCSFAPFGEARALLARIDGEQA